METQFQEPAIASFDFYYHQIKSLMQLHSRPLTRSIHHLESWLLVLFILRLINIMLVNMGVIPVVQLAWDPMARFASHHIHIYDGYFCASMIGFALFVLLMMQRVLYYQTDPGSICPYVYIYDLAVRNRDIYVSCLKDRDEIRAIQLRRTRVFRQNLYIESFYLER